MIIGLVDQSETLIGNKLDPSLPPPGLHFYLQ